MPALPFIHAPVGITASDGALVKVAGRADMMRES